MTAALENKHETSPLQTRRMVRLGFVRRLTERSTAKPGKQRTATGASPTAAANKTVTGLAACYTGSLAVCLLVLFAAAVSHAAWFARTDEPLHPAELPQLPSIKRHLGFMSAQQLAQIDQLLDPPREFALLRHTHCAVCMLLATEVISSTISMAVVGRCSRERITATISQACERVNRQLMLGVTASRQRWLLEECRLLLTPSRKSQLASVAAQIEAAVVNHNSSALRVNHQLDVCANNVCPQRDSRPLAGWAGIFETFMGTEPLSTKLVVEEVVPRSMLNQLLYFATAKGDMQAVRLILLLTNASPSAIQHHTAHSMKPLRRYLAKLLSPPSAKQQMRLLRSLNPALFQPNRPDIEAFLEGSSARFSFRTSDAVNDTSLHVAAYSYDHNTLLQLLLLMGLSGGVDAKDSWGRTALHYGSDMSDQLAGLVSVFAEPSATTTTLLQLRSNLRMAADHEQHKVVEALSDSQAATIKLLIAFGADVNTHSHQSGSTPLHLAARSGSLTAATILIAAGATVDSRNRHGFTPLIVATTAGHAAMCRLLLDAGAAREAQDGTGRSVQWYATAAGGPLQPPDTLRLFGVAQSPAVTSDPAAVDVQHNGWGAHDRDTLLADIPDICEFDRISSNSPPSRFQHDYLNPGRPVVLTRAAEHMPAKQKWTRQAFLKLAGDSALRAQKLPVRSQSEDQTTLRQYLKEVSEGQHPVPLSWNVPQNNTLWALLERDLSWPAALSATSQQELASFGLFIGSQRSGTSMHYHRAAWNALLFGRKLWVLTPPARSSFRRHQMALTSFHDGWLEEVRSRAAGNGTNISARRICVQQEGDVIFVPAGWGHATLNLNESVGVASFFSDQEASGLKPNQMWHSARGIRSIQTAAGISAPSDYDHDGHEQ